MNTNQRETFLTTVNDTNQLSLYNFNDEDMDLDIRSVTSSTETPKAYTEVEQVFDQKEHYERSSILFPRVESIDGIGNEISMQNPTASVNDQPTQTVIPRAVYDYAAMVNHTLESPRQNKLDHDVTTVLGSSDPPPGFGFLHPRFYYLEQKRPFPLEPLQVWRGYNGHVYFSPIQVHQLESDRASPPAKSLKSLATESIPIIHKATTERANIPQSPYRNRIKATRQTKHLKERILPERLLIKKRLTTNATITSPNEELEDQTSTTLIDDEEIKQKSSKMWQSVVTSAHVRVKPISKRSQHAMEDLQALHQEQTLQDPTGYNRQVLPNIRPVAKSKFVYKGLAYKESQKLPGIINGNGSDDEGNPLQKPLVAYNLAQAYARYEINAARAKQNLQQQPPPPSAATGALVKDQQSTDLRDMRKRIIRGTTLAYRPPPQSVAWTPGRGDHCSTLGSEVLLPIRGLNAFSPSLQSPVYPSPSHPYITVHTTPNLSQIFHIPTADVNTNVSSL